MTNRRIISGLQFPSETAIDKAISEVEKVGASKELTVIITSLSEARRMLSNFLDREARAQLNNSCTHHAMDRTTNDDGVVECTLCGEQFINGSWR